MTLFQAIFLGIIQGLTEFLPISSSAHLVLTPYLLGWQMAPDEAFVFNVLVQMGTLLAVIVYFWKDFWGIGQEMVGNLLQGKPFASSQSRLGWLIILATLPAGVIGLAIKDLVEAAFASPIATAIFLLVTAVFLVTAERVGKRSRSLDQLNWKDALWIGFFQAASIFPGVSRSGSTITGGMLRNVERPTAARFSFLISLPIMLAAGGLALVDLTQIANLSSYIPVIISGLVTSTVVGYLSIRWLLRFLNTHTLVGFALYCIALSLLVLAISAVRAL
jgi:undecaprenyl-diphosphatase